VFCRPVFTENGGWCCDAGNSEMDPGFCSELSIAGITLLSLAVL